MEDLSSSFKGLLNEPFDNKCLFCYQKQKPEQRICPIVLCKGALLTIIKNLSAVYLVPLLTQGQKFNLQAG